MWVMDLQTCIVDKTEGPDSHLMTDGRNKLWQQAIGLRNGVNSE